ncbi:MAG: hypothetical protein M1828_005604 [Chrysothrix sp. TS-e1954]|nr:MAG: hypothetical protein M1828_005604 [Chrysothrix sp. TS-e1954]
MVSLAPSSARGNTNSSMSYVESITRESYDARPGSSRGIGSFLRRSKSREENGPSEVGRPRRKLTRKRAKSVTREGAPNDMAPTLPLHSNTSNFHVPLGPSQNSSVYSSSTPTYYNNPSHRYNNSRLVTPTRSGYNPNTFYQRYRNMDHSEATSTPPHGIPVPPVPGSSSGQSVDTDLLARTESMTNRGRYSYATSGFVGNVNSPRRMRRRKDPTPLNILVVGTKYCGKTSFIEFLKSALTLPLRNRNTQGYSPPPTQPKREPNSSFTPHYIETELEGERIGLTLWDSNGLERPVIDLQLRELSSFFESKFQETFYEEQKVLRATGVRDTHIHCVFLLLDPSRLDQNLSAGTKAGQLGNGPYTSPKQHVVGSLDQDLDIDVFTTMQGKTTVIPVISRADTVTTAHMTYLKRSVSEALKKLKIDPLEALSLDSDDESEYGSAPSAIRESQSEDDDTSTTYGDAQEGNPVDGLAQKTKDASVADGPTADGPLPNEPGKSKTFLLAPQHDELRMSAMSENVDLPLLPLSVISPDMYEPGIVGRRFPWGFVDPYNAEHCDFVRLKDSVFSEWRSELRSAARDRWYEGWRTSRLKRRGQLSSGGGSTAPVMNTGRSVSGAAAYGGKGPETSLRPPVSVSGNGRAVSASDIGVAVSNGIQQPAVPKSYRGVGTY